jgi:inosose dehydratase
LPATILTWVLWSSTRKKSTKSSPDTINFCPDIAHLVAGGGDALELVKKYYSRIQYVHLKDLSDDGFVPLGKGKIDLAAIIDYLKAQGYTGDYLVEIDGYLGDPTEACQISYEYIRDKLILLTAGCPLL